MDEVVWIEVLSRHRTVVARYRCAGAVIRIGRAYSNDVVLDDPFVAAEHLRVFRDEGGLLIAEDIGSANGLFEDQETARRPRIVLDRDQILRIGRVHLRIRDASHAVPRERLAEPPSRLWPVALALSIAVVAAGALSLWLAETTEPRILRYLEPLLTLVFLVGAWAAGWAVFSRILLGQARFERHLIVALAGTLALSLVNESTRIAAFSLAWRGLALYAYIGLWGIAALICLVHLHEIGPTRMWLKSAVVGSLAGFAIATQALMQSEARFASDQQAAAILMPPDLRLAPLQNEDAFFADVERTLDKLDRMRSQEGP